MVGVLKLGVVLCSIFLVYPSHRCASVSSSRCDLWLGGHWNEGLVSVRMAIAPASTIQVRTVGRSEPWALSVEFNGA